MHLSAIILPLSGLAKDFQVLLIQFSVAQMAVALRDRDILVAGKLLRQLQVARGKQDGCDKIMAEGMRGN